MNLGSAKQISVGDKLKRNLLEIPYGFFDELPEEDVKAINEVQELEVSDVTRDCVEFHFQESDGTDHWIILDRQIVEMAYRKDFGQ